MNEQEQVDISGMDKAEVLAALYNASAPVGMGHLQAVAGEMTTEHARKVIDGHGDDTERMFPGVRGGDRTLIFDYLFGRPLKLDLSKDSFNPWGFDRDNGGNGTAAKIIARLRG